MIRRAIAVVAAAAALAAPAAPRAAEAAKPGPGTYVYVHDRTTVAEIHGFSLAADGTLTELAGSPFGLSSDGGECGGYCQTMAYSAKRKLLFAGSSSGGVTVLRVLQGGALEEVAGSPFTGAGADDTLGVAVVERGSRTFVYGADFYNDRILAFEVQDDDTLTPVPGSPYPTDPEPIGIASAKDRLFACGQQNSALNSWRVADDGSLTSSGAAVPVEGISYTFNVNPDPSGRFVYTGGGNGTIAAFAVDRETAALTPLDGSPFDGVVPDIGNGVAVSKKLVAATSTLGGGIENLQILRRQRDGSLEPLGPEKDTGIEFPGVSTFDAKGRTLVIASVSEIVAMRVNSRSGEATADTPVQVSMPGANQVVIVRR